MLDLAQSARGLRARLGLPQGRAAGMEQEQLWHECVLGNRCGNKNGQNETLYIVRIQKGIEW